MGKKAKVVSTFLLTLTLIAPALCLGGSADNSTLTVDQSDVLIIQIGDVENQKLTVGDVITIIKKLKAKIIIPAHCLYPQRDLKILAELLANNTATYVANERLVITKEDLQAINSPQVMILDN